MNRTCLRIYAFIFLHSINAIHALAGEGGGRHRIRVTPDFDVEGYSAMSEFNVYQGALFSNFYVDYLSEDGFDIGLNSFNVPISGPSSASNGQQYDTFLNLTKFFYLDGWVLGMGTQNGTSLGGHGKKLHNFDFAQVTYEWKDWLKLTAGSYYISNALSQSSQNVGALVGVDIEFIDKTLWLEMDWLGGNNSMSGAVINQFWKPTQTLILYAGTQIPAPNSGNRYAGIIGFGIDFD